MNEAEKFEYSRVRCDSFWFEVLERAPELTELLDYGDDDWVELSGRPDGRPIWLRASLVDYVESASSPDASAGLDTWLDRLMKTRPAGRCERWRRRVTVRSFRTRRRSWCTDL